MQGFCMEFVCESMLIPNPCENYHLDLRRICLESTFLLLIQFNVIFYFTVRKAIL